MTIINGYVTSDEAEDYSGAPISGSIDQVVEAVSRQIDGYCERVFYQSGTEEEPESRVFATVEPWVVHFGAFNDLVSASAVTEDDTSVTYQLEPRNRSGPEPRPYTSLRNLGGSFVATEVTVSGVWGWPAVPTAVKQACLIQVSRLAKRPDSPLGVAGFGEFGVVKLSPLDPDVKAMLQPYRIIGGFA